MQIGQMNPKFYDPDRLSQGVQKHIVTAMSHTHSHKPRIWNISFKIPYKLHAYTEKMDERASICGI